MTFRTEYELMGRISFLVSLALAALVALLLSAMNPHPVEIELAFFRLAAPLGLGLVVAFVLGLLAGLFTRAYWVAELLSERGRLRRSLRLAEAQAREAKREKETADSDAISPQTRRQIVR